MIIDSHAHYNNNAFKKPFRYLTYDKDGYILKEGAREQLFREFVSFVNDADGNPIFENTMQYAILKKEWEVRRL